MQIVVSVFFVIFLHQRALFEPNLTISIHFGGIPGEFGRAMVYTQGETKRA